MKVQCYTLDDLIAKLTEFREKNPTKGSLDVRFYVRDTGEETTITGMGVVLDDRSGRLVLTGPDAFSEVNAMEPCHNNIKS